MASESSPIKNDQNAALRAVLERRVAASGLSGRKARAEVNRRLAQSTTSRTAPSGQPRLPSDAPGQVAISRARREVDGTDRAPRSKRRGGQTQKARFLALMARNDGSYNLLYAMHGTKAWPVPRPVTTANNGFVRYRPVIASFGAGFAVPAGKVLVIIPTPECAFPAQVLGLPTTNTALIGTETSAKVDRALYDSWGTPNAQGFEVNRHVVWIDESPISFTEASTDQRIDDQAVDQDELIQFMGGEISVEFATVYNQTVQVCGFGPRSAPRMYGHCIEKVPLDTGGDPSPLNQQWQRIPTTTFGTATFGTVYSMDPDAEILGASQHHRHALRVVPDGDGWRLGTFNAAPTAGGTDNSANGAPPLHNAISAFSQGHGFIAVSPTGADLYVVVRGWGSWNVETGNRSRFQATALTASWHPPPPVDHLSPNPTGNPDQVHDVGSGISGAMHEVAQMGHDLYGGLTGQKGGNAVTSVVEGVADTVKDGATAVLDLARGAMDEPGAVFDKGAGLMESLFSML